MLTLLLGARLDGLRRFAGGPTRANPATARAHAPPPLSLSPPLHPISPETLSHSRTLPLEPKSGTRTNVCGGKSLPLADAERRGGRCCVGRPHSLPLLLILPLR